MLGFAGPKAEAEEIKQRLAQFLRDDLALELSQEKTLVTHARTGAAKFLGYEVTVQHSNRKVTRGRRSVNGAVRLRVPRTVVKEKCAQYMECGEPAHRSQLVNDDDYGIISTYGAEYRGVAQYYMLAGDVHSLHRLRWVMSTSLLKTLACKYDSTVSKMAARYQATAETPHGPRKCLQVSIERGGKKPLVARFGGIPLRRQKKAVLHDRKHVPVATRRKELVRRLMAGWCEMCGHAGEVKVHHVRKLADLGKPGQPRPEWAELMAQRRRKTLVVCHACYDTIHAGQPTARTA